MRVALFAAFWWFAPLAIEGQATPPSVTLPADLDRVLKDYERGWGLRDASAVAQLFTPDGFALPDGQRPARGRAAIESAYQGHGGPLRLRALAWGASDSVAYIVGAYTYGERSAPDQGKFVLALTRDPSGRWLIAADIDNSIKR
jgi:ketosteroid isomerase-like protein